MMPPPPQYIDCRRCNCYFYPYPISANATVRCPNCNTSNPLPGARPPPPPPTPNPLSPQFDLNQVTTVFDDLFDSLALDYFDFDYFYFDQFESHPVPSAATATAFIESLKARKVTVTGNMTSSSCVVCYDEFQVTESVNQMPCGHWFHSECIIKWLNLKDNCPLCRHEFPRDQANHHVLQSPVTTDGVITNFTTMMSEDLSSDVSPALPTEVRIGEFDVAIFVDSSFFSDLFEY